MKICKMCKNELPNNRFNALKASRDGLQFWCRDCAKIHRTKNKEKIKETRKIYQSKNRDKITSYAISQYWKNRDKILARSRAYYKTSEGKLNGRVQQHKRRARKRGAEGSHTKEDIKELYKKQNGKCYWCSCVLNNKYHVDHIIPLSRGGTDYKDNLVISCQTCNQRKYTKTPDEFLK
mgnify:CR=1 FL=1